MARRQEGIAEWQVCAVSHPEMGAILQFWMGVWYIHFLHNLLKLII